MVAARQWPLMLQYFFNKNTPLGCALALALDDLNNKGRREQMIGLHAMISQSVVSLERRRMQLSQSPS